MQVTVESRSPVKRSADVLVARYAPLGAAISAAAVWPK